MKYLKVDNGKGFFLRDETYEAIDGMSKDDILKLLDIATNPEQEFEMDSIAEIPIVNEAHSIIYKSLYDKFNDLLSNRTRFFDESMSVYKSALEKYSE